MEECKHEQEMPSRVNTGHLKMTLGRGHGEQKTSLRTLVMFLFLTKTFSGSPLPAEKGHIPERCIPGLPLSSYPSCIISPIWCILWSCQTTTSVSCMCLSLWHGIFWLTPGPLRGGTWHSDYKLNPLLEYQSNASSPPRWLPSWPLTSPTLVGVRSPFLEPYSKLPVLLDGVGHFAWTDCLKAGLASCFSLRPSVTKLDAQHRTDAQQIFVKGRKSEKNKEEGEKEFKIL